SSGLPVSYTAATPASVCALDSGKVKTVGVGQCTVTASQGGNGNFNPALSLSSTFNVIYRWDGFLQPVNDTAHTGGYESKFKTGSTVPLKFQLKNALGTPLQQLTPPTFSRGTNRGSCDTYTNTETVAADDPTAGAEYRWDSSAQQYIYNFSTKNLTAGEYRVYAGLGDGITYSVDICLTK
ncbi:MAG TPA: PxKF domain-containing protein, partial [Thermoleophilaceae bacterium]|nr:PxKF domain-containing protein [Thermoleophilaceae bacterium]